MKSQRTIVIGDVHGCLEELEELLNQVQYASTKDRLIFAGDFINRGPCSLEVLEKIQSLRADAVMGNHELGFLKYLKDPSFVYDNFPLLKSQMGNRLLFWSHWLERLPLFIEEKEFIVVHAGLAPNQAPFETSADILTRIRTWDGQGTDLNNPEDPSWFELYHDPKLVLFGHWAKKGLVFRDNAIGLDTGCVYGKKLTAVVLPERSICQVPAKQIYEIPEE
ncbi:MAG: metallophosphoesterase [SAR324 cluster bacterium]|nr:metallophosphoesterase [SAR324 cluster bacterium]